MAVYLNGLAMRRRWFVLMTLLALGLVLGIGALLWHAVQTSSVVTIQTRIAMMQPIFTVVRFLVIVLVALSWPATTRALHRSGRLDEAGAARLLSLRWRIVTWSVMIEVVLGHNLLGRFLVALHGTSI